MSRIICGPSTRNEMFFGFVPGTTRVIKALHVNAGSGFCPPARGVPWATRVVSKRLLYWNRAECVPLFQSFVLQFPRKTLNSLCNAECNGTSPARCDAARSARRPFEVR